MHTQNKDISNTIYTYIKESLKLGFSDMWYL